ncbi:MAG: hypothetical protein K2X93_09080 [Candidatus Obscuribacterales bacterium]|nr:hypothetical protein [Candidatus Obscuribacterales bacterium]
MCTSHHAQQANKIVEEGSADFVALAREALNNPQWFFQAEQQLGQAPEGNPYEQ